MSDISQYYDQFYRKYFLDLDESGNNFRKIAPLWTQLDSSSRVLDIGCGAGSVSVHIVNEGNEVYGLDISQEAVRRAQAKGLKAQIYDISKELPFESRFFNCVLALDILEHLFDPLGCLKEVHRVLKPEGYAIIVLPLHFNIRERLRILFGKGIIDSKSISLDSAGVLKPWTFDHIRFFTLREAKEIFREAGFRIEAESYSFISLQLPGRLRRVGRWLIVHSPKLFASEIKVRLRKV